MPAAIELRQLLQHKIVGIALLSLLLALPGLWYQARSDIHAESRGAEETAEVFALILSLQNSTQAQLDEKLKALGNGSAWQHLRHLQLTVRDESGHLLTPPPTEDNTLALRLFAVGGQDSRQFNQWIQCADGRRLQVSIHSRPSSEAEEAQESLVDLLIWCALYTALLVTAITLAMHRAFTPLRSIVAQISECMAQNYTSRLPTLPVRELDVIGQSLNHLADTLARTESSRRQLSMKMVSVQEEERSRLVQELHDEFGQNLTAMRASASYLVRTTEPHPEAKVVAQELASQCQQLHDGIRDLLRQLRPHPTGGESGPVPLTALLDKLLTSWRDMPGQEIQFSCHCELDESQLTPGLALALYRMSQEALTNAVRHASARRIDILLRQSGDQLDWSVSDDGQGIAQPEAALERGNGLAGMRERAWAHGGQFRLTSTAKGSDLEGSGLISGLTLAATFRLQTSPTLTAVPQT
ncbi:MAG TPA: histidine kinase [Rhodocyclaceae bacterium]|nr:histidine kinase [Rhodocyclaceae bacterium]